MINRFYLNNLDSYIKPNKVLVIYGARRVGKTTLIQEYLKNTKYNYLTLNGDSTLTQELFNSQNINTIQNRCKGYELIFIDEAQNIDNIGISLKLMVDTIPNMKIIATGSSSFDLANKVGEPLVGRKTTKMLYPVSLFELQEQYNNHYELNQDLENYLLFGLYPEVITLKDTGDKIEYLNEILGSYLYKDILDFNYAKRPDIILKLLKLLAFQIGSEVSLNELANHLDIDKKTVDRYLYLLEKSFVIFNLGALKRNLRNEINRSRKYYFYDLGIRNAIISNFNTLEYRNDIGALWENFLLIERYKYLEYNRLFINKYFWRTYEQKEIDYIEEANGILSAFEFKYNSKAKVKPPKLFLDTYTNSEFNIINQGNYLDFIL